MQMVRGAVQPHPLTIRYRKSRLVTRSLAGCTCTSPAGYLSVTALLCWYPIDKRILPADPSFLSILHSGFLVFRVRIGEAKSFWVFTIFWSLRSVVWAGTVDNPFFQLIYALAVCVFVGDLRHGIPCGLKWFLICYECLFWAPRVAEQSRGNMLDPKLDD